MKLIDQPAFWRRLVLRELFNKRLVVQAMNLLELPSLFGNPEGKL